MSATCDFSSFTVCGLVFLFWAALLWKVVSCPSKCLIGIASRWLRLTISHFLLESTCFFLAKQAKIYSVSSVYPYFLIDGLIKVKYKVFSAFSWSGFFGCIWNLVSIIVNREDICFCSAQWFNFYGLLNNLLSFSSFCYLLSDNSFIIAAKSRLWSSGLREISSVIVGIRSLGSSFANFFRVKM